MLLDRHCLVEVIVRDEHVLFLIWALIIINISILLFESKLADFFVITRSLTNFISLITYEWVLFATLVYKIAINRYLGESARHHCFIKSFAWSKVVLWSKFLCWYHRHGLTNVTKIISIAEISISSVEVLKHVLSFHYNLLSEAYDILIFNLLVNLSLCVV